MLMVKTTIKKSKIHGIGLFAAQFIPRGTVVWKFTPGFDLRFTKKDILEFPTQLQLYLYKYCWRSKKSGLYCFSSDNGKYFNHSDNPNTLSKYCNGEDEVITRSLQDIEIGEEITDDYSSFEAKWVEDDIFTEIALRFHIKDELAPQLKRIPSTVERSLATNKEVRHRADSFKRRRCHPP